jgi:hypothetical protein
VRSYSWRSSHLGLRSSPVSASVPGSKSGIEAFHWDLWQLQSATLSVTITITIDLLIFQVFSSRSRSSVHEFAEETGFFPIFFCSAISHRPRWPILLGYAGRLGVDRATALRMDRRACADRPPVHPRGIRGTPLPRGGCSPRARGASPPGRRICRRAHDTLTPGTRRSPPTKHDERKRARRRVGPKHDRASPASRRFARGARCIIRTEGEAESPRDGTTVENG